MYFFDLENNYIASGIVFISALAKDNVRGEKLSLNDFVADQDGYLQVFVAYENGKPVWFDINYYILFVLISTVLNNSCTNKSSFRMKKYDFIVYADYSTVYVADQEFLNKDSNLGLVSDNDIRNLINIYHETGFAVYTVRSLDVHFTLIIVNSRPEINFNEWDHINECGLHISLGRVYIYGGTTIPEKGFNMELPSGYYGSLVCYKDLYKVSQNRIEGQDSYTLYLWPEDKYLSPKVLKRWPGKGYFE